MRIRDFFASWRMEMARNEVSKIKKSLADEKTKTEIRDFLKGCVIIGDCLIPRFKDRKICRVHVSGAIVLLLFCAILSLLAYDMHRRVFVRGIFAPVKTQDVQPPPDGDNLEGDKNGGNQGQ
jgi:hypothetical protein